MQKWEYLVITHPANNEKGKQGVLNTYGTEGWELVCVENNTWYIFKRPISLTFPVDVAVDEKGVVQEWHVVSTPSLEYDARKS